jgi:hypothetical protein
MVVLAAAVTPVLYTASVADGVDEAETGLKRLTDAVADFHADVGEWPASLDVLVRSLEPGDADLCGAGFNGGERNAWAGPYLDRAIPAGGLPVGIGTVDPALTRVAGDGIDFLALTIPGLDALDAEALDARVDGDGDPVTGTIRRTAPAGGTVTVTWLVPVSGC